MVSYLFSVVVTEFSMVVREFSVDSSVCPENNEGLSRDYFCLVFSIRT